MNKIINLLPEDKSSLFSFDKPSAEHSFIAADMNEYLKESFFTSSCDSVGPIYILDNCSNRSRKILVTESFRILLEINSKGFKDVDFYIFSDNKLESLKDFITASPVDTDGFFPDLEYLSNLLTETEDTQYNRAVKIKAFAEFMKFALKDRELEVLLAAII